MNHKETATELWRYTLLPLGVDLFKRVIKDLDAGRLVAVPQDEDFAITRDQSSLHR